MIRRQNLLSESQKSRQSIHAEFSLLLAAALFLAIYVLLRYGGLWGEGDTNTFTVIIRAMLDSGELVPTDYAYPNGYGYQTLVLFLIHVTGLSLSAIQLYGSILLMVWIVFPAWLLYRTLTSTTRGGVLATVILFIQPEFLFPVLRGSHEKFTRGLMLLCVYLLIRSLRNRSDLARFTAWVLAFYLASYALITFNNLLATSFIIAVSVALILTSLAIRLFDAQSLKPAIRRLTYATVISIGLALIFTFYLYQPARHDLLLMQTIGERIAALFLDVEGTSSNPYGVINTGWISLRVYFMLSLANWLLLGTSAIIWLWQSISWLLKQQLPGPKEHEKNNLLLWAFYGAFAFIGAISVASDISGAMGNLQHRIFPSFAMFAAPVVAKWLIDQTPQRKWLARITNAALWVSIGILAVLSTLKATNEPLLSNKWLFYIPAEMQALDWADKHLADRTLWVAYDERLSTALGIRTEGSERNVQLDHYGVNRGTHDFLISDVTRRRRVRLSQPLPVEADSFITFDNGQAQIYHLRPRTRYQR